MSIPEVESRNRLIAFLQGALKKLDALTVANYTFPTSDGTNNQVLTTDGNGTLTFENAGGGGGGSPAGSNTQVQFNDGGSFGASANLTFDGTDLGVSAKIFHVGDTDTYINFTADDINIQAGGVNFIDITQDTVSEITFNEAGANVDFRVEGDTEQNLLFVDASADKVGIGTDAPDYDLDVAGDIGVNEKLLHNGDPDTYIAFPSANTLNLVAGGHSFVKYENSTGKILINNGNENRDTQVMADDGNVVLHVDAGDNRVGIGTDAPQVELHISDAGSPQIRLSDPGAGDTQDVVAYTEYYKGDNTTRIGWCGYGSTTNEHFTINNQTATGSFEVKTNNTTAFTVDYQGNATVVGDLTVTGNDIKDSGGNTQLTFAQAPGLSTTVAGDLFVADNAALNACRIGAATTDPGDNNLYVEGNCTLGDSASDTVTVTGDLFVNDYARIDALRVGTTSNSPGDGNLYIEGTTTAVGQVVPGYDPGILAQNIFDPSSYALYTIVNDEDYLYIVDWDTGATSTTDPKVAFSAPTSGKVIVDVSCYMDDTSTSGAGPYIYAALSSNYGTAGTKISKTDASIVGNGEKRIWYPDESDRGVRNFSFYVSGLTGGSTYTWYLYMRRWNDGDTNRVICGGDYPMFEMSVRPIYSSALIYTT